MAHSIIQHLTYNLWANERLGHLLMAQDEAILNADQKSSFTTISKTVFHIWDAELIWLTRLNGDSLNDWPSKSFTGTKAEMLHGLIKIALVTPLDDAVVSDTQSDDRRSVIAGLG